MKCVNQMPTKATRNQPQMTYVFLRKLLPFGLVSFAISTLWSQEFLKPDAWELSLGVHARVDDNIDNRDETGALQRDITPYRVRLTPQAIYRISDNTSFVARARSQYSHSGNADSVDTFLDKYAVQFQQKDFSGWVGRSDYPFWTQNDIFWDGDITPAGVFATRAFDRGDFSTTLSGGYFYLPIGEYDFDDTLFAAQAVLSKQTDDWTWSFAGGLHAIDGQGLRADHQTISASAQLKTNVMEQELSLGCDYYIDAEAEPILPGEGDNDTAVILTASFGNIYQKGHWMVGATYAHVEENSLYHGYSQPDWLSYPRGSGARGMEGSSLWIKYALSSLSSLTTQLYLREAVDSLHESNRLRFEFNSSF